MFKLNFYVQSGGDGSANVKFTSTAEEAEQADENQSEPWGDPSADSLTLKVENNEIFYRKLEWTGKKHKEVWIPLEKA